MVWRTLLVCLALAGVALLPAGPTEGFSAAAAAAPVATGPAPSSAIAITDPAPTVADPLPARLQIPRLGVDALVEARGLDGHRNLPAPDRFEDVAWFNQGPEPGLPGNALISGHVDSWTGAAVFARLHELKPGDEVTVLRAGAARVSFRVTGLRTLPAGAHDVSLFAATARPALTLITCSGRWDPLLGGYDQRLLVTATLA